MNQAYIDQCIERIQSETALAMGCTEPAAAALCAAAAVQQLGSPPRELKLEVSSYIFKNAMNVGIPGTNDSGLNIAAALGAVCGQPEKGLSVLEGLSGTQHTQAYELAQHTFVSIAKDAAKVYIRALALDGKGNLGEAVIQGSHTNLVLLRHNGETILEQQAGDSGEAETGMSKTPEGSGLSISGIWEFALNVPIERLYFLRELVKVNRAAAKEGLSHAYGLQVGMKLRQSVQNGLIGEDICNYAASMTAAAADARMSGCEYSVMSVAGSGNQGLTATVPLIAAAEKAHKPEEQLLRGLAISLLTTIHSKEFIGRLSVLCGCAIASSIGVTAGIVYMFGGGLKEAEMGIRTIVADISGVICDGAKPGCALKIATSVSAAMRAAVLALSGIGATSHDGIVSENIEDALHNLGGLGAEGMAGTNQFILNILLQNAQNC